MDPDWNSIVMLSLGRVCVWLKWGFVVNSLRLTNIVPGQEESVTIHGNESLSVCGGVEWQIAPHCMQYQYKSSHMLETFVVDKTVYQVCFFSNNLPHVSQYLDANTCWLLI